MTATQIIEFFWLKREGFMLAGIGFLLEQIIRNYIRNKKFTKEYLKSFQQNMELLEIYDSDWRTNVCLYNHHYFQVIYRMYARSYLNYIQRRGVKKDQQLISEIKYKLRETKEFIKTESELQETNDLINTFKKIKITKKTNKKEKEESNLVL